MTFPESSAYTAIIATTANEPWLDDAVASIRRQVLPADRIIVILNGVDDEAASLPGVSGLATDISVMTLPVASQPGALAVAISSVRTPYVAFLDADDAWTPAKQQRQIGILAAHPEADACAGRVHNFTDEGTYLPARGDAEVIRMFGTTTFRISAFSRFGLPDATAPHFTWMYRWWLSASAEGIVVAPDPGLALERRVHDANSWVRGRDTGRQQLLTELRSTVQARRAAG